jgi:hypothetical protein
VSDLVHIHQRSSLIGDQYQSMQYVDEHRGQLPVYDPVNLEQCRADAIIAGEPWSITATRTAWECCRRASRRTVVLRADLPSPFDFHPSTLLRFVLSLDEQSQLNEIIIDNWILKFIRSGRLIASHHQPGYYTCA